MIGEEAILSLTMISRAELRGLLPVPHQASTAARCDRSRSSRSMRVVRKIASIPIAAHDLSDGLNTVTVVLSHGNPRRRALFWLAVDMFAPVFGAGATLLIDLDGLLPLVLAFFAGSFLYIGASDLLPKAKDHESPLVGDSNQKAQRRRARRCFKKTVALAGRQRI